MPDFHKFALKRNGGEIAVFIKKEKRNFINIYNSVGNFTTSIPISSGDVAELGWSEKEELLEIIYSDGRLLILSDNYKDFTEVSILEEISEEEIVLEAKFFGNECIAILTSENNFLIYDLFNMSKFKFIRPECLEFNSPQSWYPTDDESVIFVQNSSLYKITSDDELIQKQLGYDTICHLDINQLKGNLLILTSDYRCLVIDSRSFNVKLDVNVKHTIDVFTVSGIFWLSDSTSSIAAISCPSLGKLGILDLNQGSIIYTNFTKNYTVSKESDGLRIFENGRNWLLTFMPEIMNDLTVGNSGLSNYFDLFVKKDYESIGMLTSIQLSEIIDLASKSLLPLCFEQKLHENFVESIKYAVKVLEEHLGSDDNSKHTFSYITANFNRTLLECLVVQKLQKLGMSVSPHEFQTNLNEEKILTRLCRLNLHSSAFEIAVIIGTDVSSVLMDWSTKAIEKLKINDKELWIILSDKFFTWGSQNQKINQIDYIKLADVAIKNKRLKLALKLLKFEKDTRRKIDLLVHLNEYREAVIESVQSGEKDQSITNIMKLSLTEFFNLSIISENVQKSLISYCKSEDRVLLQILMYQDDKLIELMEDLIENDLESLEKWIQLLKTQRLFEHKYPGAKLMGLSLTRTLVEINKFGGKASRDFCDSIK